MADKYEIVSEMSIFHGVIKLYRIRSLITFDTDLGYTVRRGDIGGYIEYPVNLSQDGFCWVQDTAKVYGDARVYEDAIVSENATVRGNAHVYGGSVAGENSVIFDNAHIFGEAGVGGNALVYEDARVYGHASLGDNAVIHGSARIYGHSWVYENATVFGIAHIHGDSTVRGWAVVHDGDITEGVITERTQRDGVRALEFDEYEDTVE